MNYGDDGIKINQNSISNTMSIGISGMYRIRRRVAIKTRYAEQKAYNAVLYRLYLQINSEHMAATWWRAAKIAARRHQCHSTVKDFA